MRPTPPEPQEASRQEPARPAPQDPARPKAATPARNAVPDMAREPQPGRPAIPPATARPQDEGNPPARQPERAQPAEATPDAPESHSPAKSGTKRQAAARRAAMHRASLEDGKRAHGEPETRMARAIATPLLKAARETCGLDESTSITDTVQVALAVLTGSSAGLTDRQASLASAAAARTQGAWSMMARLERMAGRMDAIEGQITALRQDLEHAGQDGRDGTRRLLAAASCLMAALHADPMLPLEPGFDDAFDAFDQALRQACARQQRLRGRS